MNGREELMLEMKSKSKKCKKDSLKDCSAVPMNHSSKLKSSNDQTCNKLLNFTTNVVLKN